MPVLIGALCTPVTHAIMPVVQQAQVPLVIATSAGQDFVDASGAGGNAYAFKTIPSELDIARGLVRWLVSQKVKSVAIVADSGFFPQANSVALDKVAREAGLKVTGVESLAKGTTDFAPLFERLKAGAPDQVITVLGPFTAGFFRAYEASGWKVPITGRVDFNAALAAVSPQFRDAGGLANLTGIAVFTPLLDKAGVQEFITAYRAHYGLMPTQPSFFVYEATYAGGRCDPPRRLRAARRDRAGASHHHHAFAARRHLCSRRPQPRAHAAANPRAARRQAGGDTQQLAPVCTKAPA